MSEYPLIVYMDKTNGVSVKKDARKITKHLCAAFANARGGDRSIKIYSIYGHKEVMPHALATYQDAIQFCQFLEQQYGEYWDIHQLKEYEDFDIIQVCQYSVDNGNRIFVSLQSLVDRDTITYSEFIKEMETI